MYHQYLVVTEGEKKKGPVTIERSIEWRNRGEKFI